MKYALVAAAAALTVAAAGHAMAAEGNNLAAVETPQVARPILGGGISAAGGAEAYPTFTATASVPVFAGADAVLPIGGSESAVQTAASLPRGFSDGTVAYAQAQSVRRYLAEQDTRARRFAARRDAAGHQG